MNIIDFFNNTPRRDNLNKREHLENYICEYKDNNIISLQEYSTILSFIRKNSTIINFNKVNNINKKIKYNTQSKTYIEIFDDVYKKLHNIIKNDSKLWKDIISGVTLSDDQIKASMGIIDLLYSHNKNTYGLYGYAGTGKTTLITSLINYLSDAGYIGRVVFTAPTNKAVNVIKNKYFSNGYMSENIYFSTIHKLLNYKIDFNERGEKIFVKVGNKNKIGKYELVIIDECSMISDKIINDIFENINRTGVKSNILFVGDPAQLPPVNEVSSSIFTKDINSIIMKNIMRNDNVNVIGLCNEIRRWIIDGTPPKLKLYKGNKVKLYKCKDKHNKLKTEWFSSCTRNFIENSQYSNIVLTWTNNQSNIYNKEIRQKMHNKEELDRFEIGDTLLLTDFYNLRSIDKGSGKKIYTSEQVQIININHSVWTSKRFINSFKVTKAKNYNYINEKIKKCVNGINRLTKNKYNVWELAVKHLINNKDVSLTNPDDIYILYVIKEDDKKILENDIRIARGKINGLCADFDIVLRDQINFVRSKVIRPLWNQMNNIYCEPFASVSISTSITVHRSQGSTYYNVYIDADDIFMNKNGNEAKRCIYTALTRASNEIHVLI